MAAGSSSTWHGLTSGHAYSLIGAYTVNGKRLLKMRNPWSSEKYVGPYSDKDLDFWNTVPASVQTQIGHVDANDGVFFFPMYEFRKAYTSMSLAYYNMDWKIVSLKNEGGNPSRNDPKYFWVYNPADQEVIM
jgi:hypothetical protein